jgi:hypothetical protein
MEAQENAANGKAGPRTVPGRAIPVPDTVSPQLRASIAAPYRVPAWDADPKSAAEWKELINKLADAHRKLRRAGVEAELQVYEGMSHAQYNFEAHAPETKEVFTEIARFFDKHLGK